MEIFGTGNKTDDIAIDCQELLTRVMSTATLSQNDITDCINVLCYALDNPDNCQADVTALIMFLSTSGSIKSVPLLDNLVTECKLRFIRTTLFNGDTGNQCTASPRNKKRDRERFVPTPGDNFQLPAPGETGNLTVTEPDHVTGKTLIRELIIDSDGYVVRELTRRYTDINTDESEQIFTQAYLQQLDEAKNK